MPACLKRTLLLALGAIGFGAGPLACRQEDAPANTPVRPGEALPSPEGKPAPFVEIAQQVGIDFEHFIGATGKMYYPETMAAGGALFDYDNDGDLDIYAIQSCVLEPGKTTDDAQFPFRGEKPPRNRLFRNELRGDAAGAGSLRFTDVTDQAGAGDTGYGMGCAVGDYDNDGDMDLYVTNFGPNVLYRNNGDGTFTDATPAAGVDDERWSCSASFADYDGDGWLDLFVVNYVDFTVGNHKPCLGRSGAYDYCGPNSYRDVSDRLFHNNGDGTFSDVTVEAGLSQAYGAGLGVVSADLNGDKLIDIYVANDDDPNQLWINNGDGTFRDEGLMSGTALNKDGMCEAGMGVVCADFDRDGDLDLFITHLINETNTLYENLGDGQFEDETFRFNVGHSSRPLTAFGTGDIDYDNDGWSDLFIGNGAVKAVFELLGDPFPYRLPNQMLRQTEPGRFEDVSETLGEALRLVESTRGSSFGDVDNDGDIDIVVFNGNGRLRLLRNDVGNRKHWVLLRLRQEGRNVDALGAVVEVRPAGQRPMWKRVQTDGSYCSANDVRVHFGLGDERVIEQVIVRWPDGRTEVFANVPCDRESTLIRGSGRAESPS